MAKYRDGKRLGREHGRFNDNRKHEIRKTSHWRCDECGFVIRGTPRQVDRSRTLHACPAMIEMASPGGMTWHSPSE